MVIDRNKYNRTTGDESRKGIREDKISAFLPGTFPGADFSLVEPQDWAYLSEERRQLADHLDEKQEDGCHQQ